MDWHKYIQLKLLNDVWGAIALDYYAQQFNPNSGVAAITPRQYIEWLIENIYEPGVNVVEFHRVFLGVCVRLLGNNFDAICEYSIRLLNIAFPGGLDEEVLSEVASHFQAYNMKERFRDLFEKSKSRVPASPTTEDVTKAEPESARRPNLDHSPSGNKVDVAIITVLPEEFEAVLAELDQHSRAPESRKKKNICAWQIGSVGKAGSDESYTVVVALVGVKGNLSCADVTRETLERWKTEYVLLVGIAAGLERDGVTRGDVVVSTIIRGYECGKIAGEFIPRDDLVYPISHSLLRNAMALPALRKNWAGDIKNVRPVATVVSKMVPGEVASGEKVVDDVTNEFFTKVLERWPNLHAVEMEGVGAAHAIHAAVDKGRAVSFLMIRGISDMPISDGPVGPDRTKAQTVERDTWKKFASSAAACFAVQMIRNVWPVPPFSA